MNTKARQTCPGCGALMNRQAEKVIQGEAAEHVGGLDATFDGILMEFHTCPACRFVLERRLEGGH